MELGHHKNLPMSEYHSSNGISKSGLSLMLKSPLNYWDAYLNPETKEREETPAQKLGSAIHCMVLEPELFDQQYVVAPKFNRRTKEGKADFEEFQKTHGAKITLTEDEMETVNQAAHAVAQNTEAQKYLTNGYAEQSYVWIDEETGVLCKCRPDFVTKTHILVDLKTTSDASEEAFAKTCANFSYEMSATFSQLGYKAATGESALGYAFIVVETKRPFRTAIYLLDSESEGVGYIKVRKALDLYAECSAKDEWPGLPQQR